MGTPLFYEYTAHYDRGTPDGKAGTSEHDITGWQVFCSGFLIVMGDMFMKHPIPGEAEHGFHAFARAAMRQLPRQHGIRVVQNSSLRIAATEQWGQDW